MIRKGDVNVEIVFVIGGGEVIDNASDGEIDDVCREGGYYGNSVRAVMGASGRWDGKIEGVGAMVCTNDWWNRKVDGVLMGAGGQDGLTWDGQIKGVCDVVSACSCQNRNREGEGKGGEVRWDTDRYIRVRDMAGASRRCNG